MFKKIEKSEYEAFLEWKKNQESNLNEVEVEITDNTSIEPEQENVPVQNQETKVEKLNKVEIPAASENEKIQTLEEKVKALEAQNQKWADTFNSNAQKENERKKSNAFANTKVW